MIKKFEQFLNDDKTEKNIKLGDTIVRGNVDPNGMVIGYPKNKVTMN